MTIEYLVGNEPRVERVDAAELHRWTLEHPLVVIVHATPDRVPSG